MKLDHSLEADWVETMGVVADAGGVWWYLVVCGGV